MATHLIRPQYYLGKMYRWCLHTECEAGNGFQRYGQPVLSAIPALMAASERTGYRSQRRCGQYAKWEPAGKI